MSKEVGLYLGSECDNLDQMRIAEHRFYMDKSTYEVVGLIIAATSVRSVREPG